MKNPPAKISDFKKVRNGGYYYIDKSELIPDVWPGSKAYLFLRPGGFGKTMNLSMLDAFFNLKYKGNSWFDGLKVSEHPECAKGKNSFPVIFLDMRGLGADSYEEFLSKFGHKVAELFSRYTYLEIPIENDYRKEMFERGLRDEMEENELDYSLEMLSGLLHKHHNVRTIILLDNYDDPVNSNLGKDFCADVKEFLGMLYSRALKGNEHLNFAVVTGSMMYGHEGICSGLNNLDMDSILSRRFDDRFGFTREEVRSILSDYERPGKYREAKAWYGGYRIGDEEMFSPKGIMHYAGNDFVPDSPGISPDALIVLRMAAESNERCYRDLLSLGNGNQVYDGIEHYLALSDLEKRPRLINSALVYVGCLRAVPSKYNGQLISVPNKWLYGEFFDAIATYGLKGNKKEIGEFFNAARSGNVRKMEKNAFSVFAGNLLNLDLSDEDAYRCVLAAAAMNGNGRYTVASEAQSKNGRPDMIMTHNIQSVPNIIIKIKRTESTDPEVQLKEAKKGIRQIKSKKYYRDLKGRTYIYGICFQNKTAKVVMEKVDLKNEEDMKRLS